MAMFLFRGPPVYAGGQGVSSAILGVVPAPSAAIAADAVPTIVWRTIPDQIFTQNETATHDLSDRATIAGGYPLRMTLAPSSAALPTGVTWNEASKSLIGTNPPTVTSVSGVVLRATSGILVGATATVPTPTVAVAATATQRVAIPGTDGDIAAAVPRPVGAVVGTATQNPPPTGIGYPTTYTIPNYQEYAFSDMPEPGAGAQQLAANYKKTFQIPVYAYTQWFGAPPPGGGNYHGDQNAPVMWKNVGGDWADINNLAQGSAPFAATAKSGTWTGWVTWDLFTLNGGKKNLVPSWLDGTHRNAGLWMRGSNSNALWWDTRWAVDPAMRPYLQLTSTSLGSVIVPCGRCIRINASSEGNFAGTTFFGTSGNSDAGMLWFDLSAYSLPDITAAVLYVHGTGTSSQTVNIFRVVNPGDPAGDTCVNGLGLRVYSSIDSQHVGVAANYDRDIGIENDPSVLFVQKFTSGARIGGVRAFDYKWCMANNDGNSGGDLVTTANSNGFTPLAGLYNALEVVSCSQALQTSTYPQSFFNAHWSPWRGAPTFASGHRLKPYAEYEELFLRYYLMWGLDWEPAPNGGKMPGFDGRYCSITGAVPVLGTPALQCLGMGRGNSGSGTDGYSGWSARGNYNRYKTPGDPLEACRALGSNDMYHIDMTNSFGGDTGWRNHYLGNLRKAQWNCIEMQVKMNTVTEPEQHPNQIATWTASGGVCTVVLVNPVTSSHPAYPFYQVGAVWSFGGVGGSPTTYMLWQNDHIITSIIDEYTFTYAIAASQNGSASHAAGPDPVPVWWSCSPSIGNYDGICRGWVNGRLADEYTHIRYRHNRFRPDGGIQGIDNAWFVTFNGGADDPIGAFRSYFSNFVVATQYIGPLVGYP